MTYFVKMELGRDKKTHMFDEDRSLCDGASHDEFSVVCKGLRISVLTCKKCIKMSEDIFKKTFAEIFRSIVR